MQSPPPHPSPRVQHVTKASSDELLRKFASSDSDSDNSPKRDSSKRRKIGRKMLPEKNRGGDDINNGEDQSPFKDDGNGICLKVVEKRSLLSSNHHHQRGRRSMALIRRLGVSSSRLSHRRGSRNKSVLGAIGKTWSKAVRGASKVFMEKHYNRHKLLINDMV